MTINLDYLKQLLETFETSENAFTNINELKKNGLDLDSEEFIFHLHLLWDKKLISTENPEDLNFGLSRISNGEPSWSVKNLRLTYDGHQFIEALRNDDIWNKLKKDFKKSGISTIVDVSKTLLSEYLKQKLGLNKKT